MPVGKRKEWRPDRVQSSELETPGNRQLIIQKNEDSKNIDSSPQFNHRLSLQERKKRYDLVRARIFGDDQRDNIEMNSTRKFRKIETMRRKIKEKKIERKAIESTIIKDIDDRRPYARVHVEGVEMTGLLDSGANVSCFGKDALQTVNELNLNIHSLDEELRTADGKAQSVVGKVRANVKWRDKQITMEIYLVPTLRQRLYLGMDFWDYYDLFPKIEEIDLKSDLKLDLTPYQDSKLEIAKRIFPSYSVLGLGRTKLMEHTIEVSDEDMPVKQKYYLMSPIKLAKVYKEIDRMLALDVIEESNSAWSSPIVLVEKPGKDRLCIDFRKVNSRTKKDAYPSPHVEGILSRLRDTFFITSLDLKDAFWQIPLQKESREKTAFTVPGRPLYHFKVMPFGLCNASQRLCRLMDRVIPSRLRENVFVYIDDLLICSPDFNSHIQHLMDVANCLTEAGLTINLEKSKFCQSEVRYLGFIIGQGELRTDPAKIQSMLDFPIPVSAKQLRRFLGMSGWYRRFLPNFATITAPLTDCLKKGKVFKLSDEALRAFESLKHELTSPKVLINPDFGKHFYLQCDASTTGIGGVLFQLDDCEQERPIAFMSQKLNSAQMKYTVTELECLAAVVSVDKFRPYIDGLPFTIITDHMSLKWLLSQKELAGRLARWSLKLQAFDFKIVHRKGSENVVPDALSRMYVDEISVTTHECELDLRDPAFSETEYQMLGKYINENSEKLPDLKVENGIIFKRTRFRRDVLDGKMWTIWVPTGLRQNLLGKYHCHAMAGHGGIGKTVFRLREKYFWPGMANDTKYFIQNCNTCKCSKASNVISRPPMGNQITSDRIFQRLYVDFCGPYPRSRQGNCFVFVVLDHFSKFVFLKPMRSATAVEVVKYLEADIFHVFGVPEVIVSDNGRQFVSETFSDLLKRYGVKHMRTAVYAPQVNSSERVNRSMLSIIRSYLGDADQRLWDTHVSKAAFALRSAFHEAIQMEPYRAVFGQSMIQHGDSYGILRKLGTIAEPETDVLTNDVRFQLLRRKITTSLKQAYEKGKMVYNMRTRKVNYKIGQCVYRKNFKLSNALNNYSAKLAPKYVKSIVLKEIGNSLYELGDINGKPVGIYHAANIRI